MVDSHDGHHYGGDGGGEFKMEKDECHVKAIRINCGSLVDGFQVRWSDNKWSDWHGGEGGGQHVFRAGKKGIKKIFIRHGGMIDAMRFFAKNGKESDHFGGEGGGEAWEEGDDDEVLVGFKGRCGAMIDQIQPIWGKRKHGGDKSSSSSSSSSSD